MATPDSIPDSGDYEWMNGDGTSTTLTFNKFRFGSYTVVQITTESDGTISNYQEITNGAGSTSTTSVSSRDLAISIRQGPGGDNALVVNGKDVLNVDNIQQESVDGVEYTGGTISRPDGTVFAMNVTRLSYYDGLRFYEFTRDTINDLPGPGMLYYNPETGTALYSINLQFNTQLDTFIRSMTVPPSPITVAPITPSPSTVPSVTLPPSTVPSVTLPPITVPSIIPSPSTVPSVTPPPSTVPSVTPSPSTVPLVTPSPSTDPLSVAIGTVTVIIIIISFVSMSWIIVCVRIYKRRKLLRRQQSATDSVLR